MARQKLTDEERRSIRESHEQGISITALADRFGVAFNTIKRICYPELDKQQRAVSREYYNKNKQQIYETPERE